MKTAAAVSKKLKALGSPQKAKFHQRFFRTGPGEYGEGDVFIGTTVPETRQVANMAQGLSLTETLKLLKSKKHEERMASLFILTHKYQKANTPKEKQAIYNAYCKHFKYVNNWDLVDCSAHKIVGAHLIDKSKAPLYKWAKSKHLWTKRISIVTTWWFIRDGQVKDTMALSKILLGDDHDLIHKAVGWMLREAGKKDLKALLKFLDQHHKKMPRTMLRYSLEKLTPAQKKKYMTN